MSARNRLSIGALLLLLFWPATVKAQGLILSGAGAAHRGMAGASTAAPLDAAGAGYWKPAAISGLQGNQVYFGAEMIYADTRVEVEPLGASGSTFSDTGLASIPTIAMVYHKEDSPMTVGLGVYGVSGGGVNFPSQQAGPPLSSLTNQYAAASVLQIAPSVSLEVTDRLAVGVGPTVDVFMLSLDPAVFVGPNADDTFPAATHGRPFWGAGFQTGLYYELNPCWSFGLSYKSPQWFETFRWNSLRDGVPTEISLDMTLPAITSMGMAYRGFERTTLAFDVRYLDYAGTKLLGEPPSAGGTGWQSIFSAALGVERQITDRCKVRMGYLFNENPIPQTLTLLNTMLPAINQHQFSLGFSMRMTRAITTDFAWVHGFENSIRGPIPTGQLPPFVTPTVGLSQSFDSWVVGMGVDF